MAASGLYPCPVCGKEPDVRREPDGFGPGPMWVARCWCTMAVDHAEGGLRHRWNDLYCANDPATAEDCR